MLPDMILAEQKIYYTGERIHCGTNQIGNCNLNRYIRQNFSKPELNVKQYIDVYSRCFVRHLPWRTVQHFV